MTDTAISADSLRVMVIKKGHNVTLFHIVLLTFKKTIHRGQLALFKRNAVIDAFFKLAE